MKKRSLTIAGHRTSISLEEAFWQALHEIARTKNMALAELVADIDKQADGTGLSSRIRVFILKYYQERNA